MLLAELSLIQARSAAAEGTISTAFELDEVFRRGYP